MLIPLHTKDGIFILDSNTATDQELTTAGITRLQLDKLAHEDLNQRLIRIEKRLSEIDGLID